MSKAPWAHRINRISESVWVQRAGRTLLSVFLIYHLFVITLMPLSGSVIGRKWGHWMAPYANALGMNATWEFFSPDPPQPFYFNYGVYFETPEGEELMPPVRDFFPEWRTEQTLHPNHIRLKNTVLFFAINRAMLEQTFARYLCRRYPDATRVKVRQIIEMVPNLEKILGAEDFGRRSGFKNQRHSPSSSQEERWGHEMPSVEISCDRSIEEEGLGEREGGNDSKDEE